MAVWGVEWQSRGYVSAVTVEFSTIASCLKPSVTRPNPVQALTALPRGCPPAVKESAEVQASLIKTVEASGRVEPNFAEIWKARICAYIVDWNLAHNGKRIPFSRAAVDNMSKPAWDHLEQVVQAHIEAMETKHAGKPTGSMSTPGSASAE